MRKIRFQNGVQTYKVYVGEKHQIEWFARYLDHLPQSHVNSISVLSSCSSSYSHSDLGPAFHHMIFTILRSCLFLYSRLHFRSSTSFRRPKALKFVCYSYLPQSYGKEYWYYCQILDRRYQTLHNGPGFCIQKALSTVIECHKIRWHPVLVSILAKAEFWSKVSHVWYQNPQWNVSLLMLHRSLGYVLHSFFGQRTIPIWYVIW